MQRWFPLFDIANWAFEGEPVSVIGTGGLDYWKDGREVSRQRSNPFLLQRRRKTLLPLILFNGHHSNGVMIMGDQGPWISPMIAASTSRTRRQKSLRVRKGKLVGLAPLSPKQPLKRVVLIFPEKEQG